jgi:hypothetical protein
MKLLTVITLLILAGCSTQHYPRSVYADPDATPIRCGHDAVPVVVKFGGGRLKKSAGGDRWDCMEVDSFDDEMEEHDDWNEGE